MSGEGSRPGPAAARGDRAGRGSLRYFSDVNE
jgi:hypothetical protein